MTLRVHSRFARVSALALTLCGGFLVNSCGAGQTDAVDFGIETPLRELNAPPRSAAPAQVVVPSGATAVARREYEPLLLDATFLAVREALDNDDPAQALRAFQRALETRPVTGATALEYAFQRGRLALQAGSYALAANSFEQCATGKWELSAYCRYYLGRALLGQGANARVVKELSAVPTALAPLSASARRLRGQAAYLAGLDEVAVADLRADLAVQPRVSGWTQSALLLARALTRSPGAATSGAVPILPPSSDNAAVLEILEWVRRVQAEAAGTSMAKEAALLEKQTLQRLAPDARRRLSSKSALQRVAQLNALVDSRQFDDAQKSAAGVLASLSKSERSGPLGCEARIAWAKASAGQSKWAQAADTLELALSECSKADLRERALFLAGKYAAADERPALAIRWYAQLEREAPRSRYADDARLRGAEAYLGLGDEAAFTRLLGSILEDYPEGDLALDGAFRLALRRIEKLDWTGAANVLSRALSAGRIADRTRDLEYLGRERYFLARAWVATGEVERGLAEYEALIRELPLSFYMQLAYARLSVVNLARAEAAKAQGIAEAAGQAAQLPTVLRVNAPEFERALALLRQGEVEWAEQELRTLTGAEHAVADLLWVNARVFAGGVASKLTHQWARSRPGEWAARWPAGEWRSVWELAFPRPHRELVTRESTRNVLPESWIYAVMREESGFEPKAESPANARGLMQLMRPTAKRFAKELGLRYSDRSLFNPAVNIALGSRVLRAYQESFPTNPLLAIPGYNAGPGRPRRWLREATQRDFDVWVELIPFTETRRYTKRVLSSLGAYEFLYGDATQPFKLPVELAVPVTETPTAFNFDASDVRAD